MQDTSTIRAEANRRRAAGMDFMSKGDYVVASRIYLELVDSAQRTAGDFERLIVCRFALRDYGEVVQEFEKYRSCYSPKFRMVSLAYFASCIIGESYKDNYLSVIRSFPGEVLERHLKLGAEVFRSLADSGYIEDAYLFKRSMAQLLSSKEPFNGPPYLTYQMVAASVFLGKFDRAKQIIDGVPSDYKWGAAGKLFDEISLFCEISGRGEVYADRAWGRERLAKFGADIAHPQKYVAPNESFKELIFGKRIAIVGPADTGHSLKDEIDSYDVVVRTNVFSQNDYLFEDNRIGSRVDVSYYTRATASIRKEDLIEFGKRSDAVLVFRNLASVREFGEENLRAQDRVILNDICPFMPTFRAMHAIQRIAWDLLKFGPSTIKVFNSNFFVGRMYHEKYRPRRKAPGLKSLGMDHDPLQSFMFTKRLHEIGLLEFDDVAEGVLEMSEDDYVKYLQEHFGSAWRNNDINITFKV